MDMISFKQEHLKGRSLKGTKRAVIKACPNGSWEEVHVVWPDGQSMYLMVTKKFCWEI